MDKDHAFALGKTLAVLAGVVFVISFLGNFDSEDSSVTGMTIGDNCQRDSDCNFPTEICVNSVCRSVVVDGETDSTDDEEFSGEDEEPCIDSDNSPSPTQYGSQDRLIRGTTSGYWQDSYTTVTDYCLQDGRLGEYVCRADNTVGIASNNCPNGEGCQNGACVPLCGGVLCAAGSSCENNRCVLDRGGVCRNNGECRSGLECRKLRRNSRTGTCQPPMSCTDPDGNNINRRATTTYVDVNGNSLSFTDICNSGRVSEGICSGRNFQTRRVSCPRGKRCNNGACS